MPDTRSDILISVAALTELLSASLDLIVLDISDDLETTPLKRNVIPGALAASLASDFSGPATKDGGRRPLPSSEALQNTLREFGINRGSTVVVYDNAGGAQAGRAWWTLRWAGHQNVRLLDGGLAAWCDAGQGSSSEPACASAKGDIEVSPGGMPVIDAVQSAEIARRGILLDARGRKGYEGDPEIPTTGHIPGAMCAGAKDVLDANGFFKSTEELQAMFRDLGADRGLPVGVYCGSGNAAAFELVGLYAAGLEAPLYVGSWSAWIGDPSRPIVQGNERG